MFWICGPGNSSGFAPPQIFATLGDGSSTAFRSCPRCCSSAAARFRSRSAPTGPAPATVWSGGCRTPCTCQRARCDGVGARRLPGRVPHVLEGGLARAGRGRRRAARRVAVRREDEAFVAETLLPGTKVKADPTGARRSTGARPPRSRRRRDRCAFREVDQYVRGLAELEACRRSSRAWSSRSSTSGSRSASATSRKRCGSPAAIAYPFVIGRLEKGKTPIETARPPARRSRPHQEQRGDRRHARRHEPQPRPDLRRRDGRSTAAGRHASRRASNRIIEESTGEMVEIKSDCIILEGVVCTGDYYRFCTRAIYPYWREIWLERVDEATLRRARPVPASAARKRRSRPSECVGTTIRPVPRPGGESGCGVARDMFDLSRHEVRSRALTGVFFVTPRASRTF